MEGRWIALNSLKLWKDNPRKNDDGVEPLARILANHTQRSPVNVWSRNRTIYKGNTTYKSMQLLHEKGIGAFLTSEDRDKITKRISMEKDPQVKQKLKEDRAAFEKYVRLGFIYAVFHDFASEAEATAYGLADNKASEYSDWDKDILIKMFNTLPTDLGSTATTGFTEKELTLFKQSLALPDALPEVNIQGVVAEETPYLIVTFTDESEVYQHIKQSLNLGKTQVTVSYSKLLPLLLADSKKKRSAV